MSGAPVQPEFSRSIEVEHLRDRDNVFQIEANEAERNALARRFGIVAIDHFAAEIHLKPVAEGMVQLTGRIEARVRQACVVSLVDVPALIEQNFERVFAADAPTEEVGDIAMEFDDEEMPDPLTDGMIDIGEAAAEELALSLDPYPRAPGAVFERAPEGEEPARPNPFAVLGALNKKGQ